MVFCDYCCIWFHFTCVSKQSFNTEKYICEKCEKWSSHLEENLIDMIYGYRGFQSFINSEGTYWKGIDSLVNYMEDSDFAIQVPVRYFEHFIINKAWHTLAKKMTEELVEEDLIECHI